jgi:hypothetical protein
MTVSGLVACGPSVDFDLLGDLQVTQPPLTLVGNCEGRLTSVTLHGAAGVDDLSGSVTARGFAGGGGVISTYLDTVTLHPPPGFTGSGVTFGIVTNYDIELSQAGSTLVRMELEVPDFDKHPVVQLGDVSAHVTGLLSAEGLTFVRCPCSTIFAVSGEAEAGIGTGDPEAFARFRDPVNFVLPEGWTYTLASQEAATAPEPGTLAFVAIGLISVGVVSRRRV